MILALQLPRSGRRAKPGVVGFDVLEEGESIVAPLLIVTRHTRARTLRGDLVDDEGKRRPVRVVWPQFKVGAYLDVTLGVQR